MKMDTLAFDNLLRHCSHPQRRILFGVLVEQQRPLTMHDLTRTVVKHNHHQPLSEVSGPELERIRIPLLHNDIPKFEADGFVEFEADRQLVEPTAQLEAYQSLISTIVAEDPNLDPPIGL